MSRPRVLPASSSQLPAASESIWLVEIVALSVCLHLDAFKLCNALLGLYYLLATARPATSKMSELSRSVFCSADPFSVNNALVRVDRIAVRFGDFGPKLCAILGILRPLTV